MATTYPGKDQKPTRDGTPVMVWLRGEEADRFEQMMADDVRNKTDMVRFLIRQEWERRTRKQEPQK